MVFRTLFLLREVEWTVGEVESLGCQVELPDGNSTSAASHGEWQSSHSESTPGNWRLAPRNYESTSGNYESTSGNYEWIYPHGEWAVRHDEGRISNSESPASDDEWTPSHCEGRDIDYEWAGDASPRRQFHEG